MTAMPSRTSARLLGIDGGGTTTEAWLAEPGGHVLGRGIAGPSNAKAVGPEAARRALEKAILGAFHVAGLTSSPVDVICLGLAGFDRPDDRKTLARWADEAGWAHRIMMVNDGDLVVAAKTVTR
jgi:N-acetylglucosamine kinase-like BadF-type ATPase